MLPLYSLAVNHLLEFLNYIVYQFLKIVFNVFIFGISVDSLASHLDLHCLSVHLFTNFLNKNGKVQNRWVCLFCCFMSQVNSYGHGGTVSSPNLIFSWASLNKQLTSTSCTYFRL